ncbi:MAG: complex I subunit 5 family protein [Clostridium sp.]
MDLNFLMPLTLVVLIAFGLLIYKIKDENKLWMATGSIVIVGVITNLVLLLNRDVLSQGEVGYTMFSDFGIGFRVNSFGILFSLIACLLWLVSVITSKEYFKNNNKNLNRFYSATLITLAGCLGVFYGSDLFTLFVFFEMMSFASYIWVAHNQNEKSVSASNSYLAFAVIGGLSMLCGIFILFFLNSDISLVNLQSTFSGYKEEPLLIVSGFLMFIGFGAKAGAFMLHDWLPQSYTAAPSPATALLSGVLSKAGLYGLIIVTIKILPFSKTWAMFILVLSICNMLYGAVFAFLSKDLKRTLAFSSLSQVGFILWGIAFTSLLGEHNTFAAFGTVFHMINHSLIKGILFSCAGIIYLNTNSFDLNNLKGYGKNKPWLKGIFAIGAMSLMGIPLLSGYVSKTLLHESVVEYIHFFHESVTMFRFMEGLFLLAGGFTFAYMLKLFICIFVQSPEGNVQDNKEYATKKTMMALTIPCVLLVILGVTPNLTFNKIGNSVAEFLNAHTLHEDIAYFSLVNLKGAVISIVIGLMLYFIVARNTLIAKNGYNDPWNEEFTIENKIYKPLLNGICFVFSFFARICDILADLVIWVLNRLFFKSIEVPKTFLEGKVIDEKRRVGAPHISYSLAYSLLLFGIGFIFTLIYLLIVVFKL